MKPRLYLPLGVLLLHPGCAFFGVERSDCFPELDCPVTGGDGDGDLPGDGDIVGDGDGDVPSSGGIGVGDGDGDENIYPSTGGGGDGDGDGDLMGGAPPVGGGDGSGGTSGGGSGGAPTGGSGGMADGGTGGGAVGGSGGDSTGGASAGGSGGDGSGGGSGGDGSGGADPGVFTVLINEIYTQYVEVFLFQSSGVPVALDDFRIVVNNEVQNACVLTGVVVDTAEPYYIAQKAALPCIEGSRCIAGCTFDTIGASMEVRLERKVDGEYEAVDTQLSANTPLSGGESYQRRPDGTGDFVKATPYTPSASNGL